MQAILSVNGNKAMNYLLQTVFEKEFDFIPVADVFHGLHIMRTEKNISALIVDVDFSSRPFHCKGDSGDMYVAETLIICAFS